MSSKFIAQAISIGGVCKGAFLLFFFVKRGFCCLWSTVDISHYLLVPGLLDGDQSPGRTSGWGSVCSSWQRNGDTYGKGGGLASSTFRTLFCLGFSFSTRPLWVATGSSLRVLGKFSSPQDLKYFWTVAWPYFLPSIPF